MSTLFLALPAAAFSGGTGFGLAGAMALILLLAMAWDARWGEPPAAVHPVVWMGRYLGACGRVTVRCPPAAAFTLGALAWCLGALAIGMLAWGLQTAAFRQLAPLFAWWGSSESGAVGGVEAAGNVGDPYSSLASLAWLMLGFIFLAGLLKTMLSWRMLRDETGAVEVALRHSLQAGRERLAMLVSRDTSALSEAEVRESAIESLAENLNDSVVAPIFWFVLFGLPGAAVYRFANTADAMWGYRGLRNGVDWEWAGKWAARADDVLSWVPARVTALLLAMAAGGLRYRMLREEARKTPSPNSGWPMAAMALGLGVRLRKPGVYALNPMGRPARAADMSLARKYASKAVVASCLWALVAIALIIAVFKINEVFDDRAANVSSHGRH